MPEIATVSDIMTRQIVSFKPDDTLELAAELFEKYNYDGFPVIDDDRTLTGLTTAYEMILQSSKVHLPFVMGIAEKLEQQEIDEKRLEEHFESIRSIQIKEIMNPDPLVVGPGVTVEAVAKEFVMHHRVNPIPVVDTTRKLMGVVSRYDVIRFFNEQYLHRVLKGKEENHEGVLRRLSRING